MRLPSSAKSVITNLLTRDVVAGVELARSLGYAMPRDFDVGVRFIDDGARTRIRIRLNDAVYDSLVQLPDMEHGRASLADKKRMWGEAWARLQADALVVSNVWLDKHPEAASKDPRGALSLLDRLKLDDAATARWMAECRERAAAYTYTKS